MTTIEDPPTEGTPEEEQPVLPRDDQAPEIQYRSEDRTWAELRPSTTNIRGTITDESVRGLADSIVARGLLQDITVHEDGEVIYGHRRYHAIGLAIREGDLPGDWPVSVMVATTVDGSRVDEGNVTIDRLVENLMREDIDPIEEARAMQSAVGYGFTQEQLASHIGVTPGHISKRLKLLALTDLAQSAVSAGEISLDKALLLAKLDAADQEKLLNKRGGFQTYDVENVLSQKAAKVANAAVRAELEALGHTVRAKTGPAKDGYMWVEVSPSHARTKETWNGSVPKTATLITVESDRWAGKPIIKFWREHRKPEGVEVLSDYERRTTTDPAALKKAIERKQEHDREDAKRDAVRDAEARILLAQAIKVSKADLGKLWFAGLQQAILDANWASEATLVCDLFKIVPVQEYEGALKAIKLELLNEEVPQARKDKIVVAFEILGGDRHLQRQVIARTGFNPDEVEVEEPEEISEEEAEAIADQLQAAAEEEYSFEDEDDAINVDERIAEAHADDDDLSDIPEEDDVRYEGSEHPEFDG